MLGWDTKDNMSKIITVVLNFPCSAIEGDYTSIAKTFGVAQKVTLADQQPISHPMPFCSFLAS